MPEDQRDNLSFYKIVAEQRPEIFAEVINAHLEPGDVFLWTDQTLCDAPLPRLAHIRHPCSSALCWPTAAWLC